MEYFLIPLSFGDLLTLVKFNTVKKNVSFSSEYSSVFFFFLLRSHCFITAGHFPTLSWRDQRARIDIHPSFTFMKGKSFTSGKKRHCFVPIRFVPPSPHTNRTHSPNPSFCFYRRKRKWMSACVCV